MSDLVPGAPITESRGTAGRDDGLLRRLRELGSVELRHLLAGRSDNAGRRLLAAFADDLHAVLAIVEERAKTLGEALAAAPGSTLADGEQRFEELASGCRALALLTEVAAPLCCRLAEVERWLV